MLGNEGGNAGEQGRSHRPAGVHKALAHPTRLDILLKLHEQGPLSPARYCAGGQVELSVAAYHFKVLLQHEAIVPTDTVARGGRVVEHTYSIDRESLIGGFLSAPGIDESECPGGEERPSA